MGNRPLPLESIRLALDNIKKTTEASAAQLGVDTRVLDTQLSSVYSLKEWHEWMKQYLDMPEKKVYEILEYPLLILMDPLWVQSNGRLNWERLKGFHKTCNTHVPLPLTYEMAVTYEMVRAMTLVIRSVHYGGHTDRNLEASAALFDRGAGRPVRSYKRAFLYLGRLAWLKGREQYLR